MLPGDPEQLGARIVERFLTVWDATGGGPLAALLQSVAGHDDAARMLREFITENLVGPDRRARGAGRGRDCGARWSPASSSGWAWRAM